MESNLEVVRQSTAINSYFRDKASEREGEGEDVAGWRPDWTKKLSLETAFIASR
jgi:hypothetical protein